MSLEISHPSRLSVDFSRPFPTHSTSSSVTSSLTSSPTISSVETPEAPSQPLRTNTRSILSRTASLPLLSNVHGIETSSSSTSLNVKFAPLPELAPRRRRSTAPLGIASRGQMMQRRRRRQMYDDGEQDDNPMWTTEEVDAHNRRQREKHANEEFEDPFLALGKMVKGAWRKVSNKEKDGEKTESKKKGRKGGVVVAGAAVATPTDGTPTISILAEEEDEGQEEEEGRVWEEEIGDGFPRGVGQTETIMEGHREYPEGEGKESKHG